MTRIKRNSEYTVEDLAGMGHDANVVREAIASGRLKTVERVDAKGAAITAFRFADVHAWLDSDPYGDQPKATPASNSRQPEHAEDDDDAPVRFVKTSGKTTGSGAPLGIGGHFRRPLAQPLLQPEDDNEDEDGEPSDETNNAAPAAEETPMSQSEIDARNVDRWEARIESLVAQGKTRPQAISHIAANDPALHAEYLAAVNAKAGRATPAAQHRAHAAALRGE